MVFILKIKCLIFRFILNKKKLSCKSLTQEEKNKMTNANKNLKKHRESNPTIPIKQVEIKYDEAKAASEAVRNIMEKECPQIVDEVEKDNKK